jgi:hypothetical protein
MRSYQDFLLYPLATADLPVARAVGVRWRLQFMRSGKKRLESLRIMSRFGGVFSYVRCHAIEQDT